MSVFTPAEVAYLESQRLARIATSGPDCQPHVVPVSFRYNPNEDTIDIDDLASIDPWRPRMIEIRGRAEVLSSGGETVARGFHPQMFRVRPTRIVSIGMEGDGPFGLNARSVP